MLLWIVIAVVAAAAVYAIAVFNRLVRTRQMANEAWSGIDVQLKRRSDLVPNLVEAVKGYAAHERSTLDEVTALRGAARAMPDADVEGRAKAESALSAGIGRLLADPMLRIRLAQNGLARVEAEFSEAAVVARWRSLFADYGAA